MSDRDLIDAVALKTGEDACEIRRLGFTLAGPDDAAGAPDPECLFDLIDLPEAGMADWNALGFGCREPFYTRSSSGRKKSATTGSKRPTRAAA
jgi:hypothetical protein